ncbi:MAG: hypothetical protein HFF39_11555 [Lawsonibacter sp.]|nr:hypothetical protein [Lawsonibacter sp.]MCI9157083.1 hypothetical protein [Lawsonibacter sp.]
MENTPELDGIADFDELEALFGQDDSDLAKMESVMLTQNLEGFASCFPDWDLHPPKHG